MDSMRGKDYSVISPTSTAWYKELLKDLCE